MKNVPFFIRPMRLSDAGAALQLSTTEGWNQTVEDWKFFITQPENICVLAECDNKVIGTTTAINYANQIAWIGMVLVHRDYRRQGMSKALLETVFQKTQAIKSIKLDATPDGMLVYKNFGFEEEYAINRMVNLSVQNLSSVEVDNLLPQVLQSKHIDKIIAFDENVFGANRAALIQSLIKNYPEKSFLLTNQDHITGFVLGRNGHKYHHIGPVMATTVAEAKTLIAHALKQITGNPAVVDVLCDKEELINWLRSIGFTKQRHFIRMYKKENPFAGNAQNQFLICGPEFG